MEVYPQRSPSFHLRFTILDWVESVAAMSLINFELCNLTCLVLKGSPSSLKCYISAFELAFAMTDDTESIGIWFLGFKQCKVRGFAECWKKGVVYNGDYVGKGFA